MKKVSIVIPTYNEEENIEAVYARVKRIFETDLAAYDYEIIYIDNNSQDKSRQIIRGVCLKDAKVKAIFNANNFGFTRSTYYGLCQGNGDCTVLLFADMQDPPELITDFVKAWEEGNQVVVGIKNRSKENRLMYFIREIYYRFIYKISNVKQIEQFTGFGLYDASFIKILRNLEDSVPYLRGIVAEFSSNYKKVFYTQEKRKRGKSSFNFWNLYDTAMLGITSYSKVIMRMSTVMGFGLSIVCLAIAIVTFIIKLVHWNQYQVGMAGMMVGCFFMGAVTLFFLGIQGEYILNMNDRIMKRPLVVVAEKIGFDDEEN